MVKNAFYDEIASLGECDCRVLCFIAYVSESVDEDTLGAYRMSTGMKARDVDRSVKSLRANQMLTVDGYYGRWRRYNVSPFYYLAALKYLFAEHSEWRQSFSPFISRNNQFKVMPDAMESVLRKGYVPLTLKRLDLRNRDLIDRFLGIILDKDLVPLINIVSGAQFFNIFSRLLLSTLYADIPIDEEIFSAIIEAKKDISIKDKQLCKEHLSLYCYYSTGTYHSVNRPLSYTTFLLMGLKLAHKQDYPAAMLWVDKALKMKNKDATVKNVFDEVIGNFLLIALYIRLGDEKKISQYLNKSLILNLAHRPSSLLAQSKISPDSISKSYVVSMFRECSSANYSLFMAFALSLAKLWDIDIHGNGEGTYMPQAAILRFELQDLLPISDEERKRLNDIYGTPIFQASKPLPRWQRILEDIAKQSANPTVEDERKQERLIYVVGSWRIEVRLQKMLKNGTWGVGKVVSDSFNSKVVSEITCMDAVDKAIFEINGRTFYSLRNENALPKLIGSDRVFFHPTYSTEFKPVVVDEEKAYLLVEKGKTGFSFSTNIENVSADQTQYVVKKSDTHYTVINITRQEAVVYKELLDIGSIPLDGENVLMGALPAISRNVEIRSKIFKGKNALKTVDGSTKIVIQVKQDKTDEYLVEMFAKPLPEGKEHFEPGKGKPIILDTKDGIPVQVKRKLKKEIEHADTAIVFIDDDMTTEIDDYADQQAEGSYRRRISTRGLLMLLEYIKPLNEMFETEWFEGKKVKTIAEPTSWNVGLRQSGQWFEIEGNVQIDEQRVLSIAQLLQLVNFDGKSNYVKVGDNEYMIITEALRRQLAKIEAIAMKDKDSLRIPVNNASLLADAMSGDINIANQEKLYEVVDKIKASYDLNPRVPSNLNATLRDYQLEGFRWMARLDSWGAGACLADDMGLGKTVQTIAMLLYNAKKGASLVVAPTSVVNNWRNELARFAPSLSVTLINEIESDARKEIINKAAAREIILTTYGILSTEEEAFTAKEWNTVCLDEAHTIKNRDTKMAHAAHNLNAKTRIALTGTPLQNHLGELWSLFNFINPGLLGNYDMFRLKFVVPIENGNKTRQQQLRRIVLPFMLRRTKNEVVEELPDKTEIVRTVELSKDEMHAYETFRRSAKKKLEEEKKVSVSVLAEITKLRQAACAACLADKKLNYKSSKIEQLLQLVANIGEDGNRILLFSQFTSFLKMVKDAFDKEKIEYFYLDGSTTMKQRAELVRRFQDGESRIFIISLKAGGLGLNLTGANYVIHMDPWWNPAIEQQATDRAYRIGQEQKVTVYHLISEHTIEEKILRLHQSKRDLADSLLEGADVSHKITEEDLNELLR